MIALLAVTVLTASTGCGGSGKTAVPDVRGKPKKQALTLLSSRHLCPYEKPALWSGALKARAGTVVDQDPLPGARVASGTHVTVWVNPAASIGKSSGEIELVTETC